MKIRISLAFVLPFVAILAIAPAAAAEGPAPAAAAVDQPALPQDGACVSRFEDQTDPDVLSLLAGATLVSVGTSDVTYTSDGTKISRGRFIYLDKDGNLVEAVHQCTSSCSSCGVSGCDADPAGCTGCSCRSGGCGSCECTKNSETEVE